MRRLRKRTEAARQRALWRHLRLGVGVSVEVDESIRELFDCGNRGDACIINVNGCCWSIISRSPFSHCVIHVILISSPRNTTSETFPGAAKTSSDCKRRGSAGANPENELAGLKLEVE